MGGDFGAVTANGCGTPAAAMAFGAVVKPQGAFWIFAFVNKRKVRMAKKIGNGIGQRQQNFVWMLPAKMAMDCAVAVTAIKLRIAILARKNLIQHIK